MEAQVRALPAFGRAAAVVSYLATENEIPTAGINDGVICSGRPLYLPRLEERPRVVRWLPGDNLVRGVGGILEPVGRTELPVGVAALVLVPVVAWDVAGGRLGRGGGFYDRLLAALDEDAAVAGLAYEFQQVPQVPRDSWDICMGFIITERRTIICRGLQVDGEPGQEGDSLLR